MIKCKCGDENCEGKAYIDNQNQLWILFQDEELMIYLDANSIIQLIQELKQNLLNMTKIKNND